MVFDDVTDEWIRLAETDLDAAKDLFKTKKYLLSVYFCHQALEKYLKASVVHLGQQPPPIHNLTRLAEHAKLSDQLDENQKDLLESLNPFYIKARYPDYKQKLNKITSLDFAKEMISSTEALTKWLRLKLA